MPKAALARPTKKTADPLVQAVEEAPLEVLRAFMRHEIAQNPMLAFRFGLQALSSRGETQVAAYVALMRTTFGRLETEEEVFGEMMMDGFEGFGGMPGFGGPMTSMREQTMIEMGEALLRAAETATHVGVLPAVAALALAGLAADFELVGTRFGLTPPDEPLPVQLLTGVLIRMAPDAPPTLVAEWFDSIVALLQPTKKAFRLTLPASMLLRVAGELVATTAQHERLLALLGTLEKQQLTASAPRNPAAGGLSPVQTRMALLMVQAQYLAETADRPAEARRLLEAHLAIGAELRTRYLTLLSGPEVLEKLLTWTAPGAPDWALTERASLLHDLLRFADAQGRPDVVREAARRQLRELLTRPYQQQGDYAAAWQRLRATYPAAEWAAARPKLIEALEQQKPKHAKLSTGDPRYNLALTFDRLDADTDRKLAELRKRPRFELLQQFGIFWLPERAAELAGLYARAVPDFLENSDNKNGVAYQHVAQTLWRLLQHVEAEEPVVALVDELAATYPRRRLLLDSLRGVGFSIAGKPKAAPRALGDGNGDDEPLAVVRKGTRRGR